ncbi:MAG: CoA transferase [Acidobacteriota bacterium]|nr:CoA transferase [Acidobacteriota bacterium]
MTPPLHNIRVLDFSHALAGPYCTMLMAEYGAEVYKLEAPGGSDMGRGWGPPFIGGHAAFFLGLNRGKQGLAIDLKKPEGVELCLQLIEKTDILLENFRPGTMDRLGLGYAAANARNPRLIYCSISGYGQNGPERDDAAMDLIVQCSSGLVSMTGSESGEQARCGYSVADVTAGTFALIGILMALRARDQSGEGQYIDVAMQDCMISAMSSNYMTFLGSGVSPKPLGTAFPTVAPYRVFDGSDGRGFAIAIGSDRLWTAFCSVIERPDLEHHPDYETNAARCVNRPALERELAAVFSRHPAGRWIERLRAVGIPATLVRTFDEVANDPQSEAREMFPRIGGQRVTGAPVKFPGLRHEHRTGAPKPGEHSRSALRHLLGIGEGTLQDLEDRGVVFAIVD